MSELHKDVQYVQWVLTNRRRFKSAEAQVVLSYLDQYYWVHNSGNKNLLHYKHSDGSSATGDSVLRLPRRPPAPRLGLAQVGQVARIPAPVGQIPTAPAAQASQSISSSGHHQATTPPTTRATEQLMLALLARLNSRP